MLFTPWLLQDSRHHAAFAAMPLAFRDRQLRPIDALKRGKTASGADNAMARDAGRSLHRFRSGRLLGMLSRRQVFTLGFTTRSYFEREVLRRTNSRRPPKRQTPRSASTSHPLVWTNGSPIHPG